MNDLIYLFVGPVVIFIFAFLYTWTSRTLVKLTTQEIHDIWNANVDRFGTVEDFARDLERELEKKNT